MAVPVAEIGRIEEIGSFTRSRQMSDDVLGGRLVRVLEDVTLYLDPRFHRLWADLRQAALT